MDEKKATPDEAYENMLRRYDVNPLGDRKLVAQSLMRLVAVHLQTDVPLPHTVRNWLSTLLRNGAMNNVKGERLVWTAAQVRPAAYLREAEEFAHVYALMKWRNWKRDPAAHVVARALSGADVDVAALKKRVSKAEKRWTAEGPFRRSHPHNEPPEANEQHLRDGEDVIVELHATGRREASTLAIPINRALLKHAVSTRRK